MLTRFILQYAFFLASKDIKFINLHLERSGRVVKVVNFESTIREFKFTLALLVTCIRALNKFSLKSTCSNSPSPISMYQLS